MKNRVQEVEGDQKIIPNPGMILKRTFDGKTSYYIIGSVYPKGVAKKEVLVAIGLETGNRFSDSEDPLGGSDLWEVVTPGTKIEIITG